MESVIVNQTRPMVAARHAAIKALIAAHQQEYDLLLAGERAKVKASAPVVVPAMPSVPSPATEAPVPSEESLGTTQ